MADSSILYSAILGRFNDPLLECLDNLASSSKSPQGQVLVATVHNVATRGGTKGADQGVGEAIGTQAYK